MSRLIDTWAEGNEAFSLVMFPEKKLFVIRNPERDYDVKENNFLQTALEDRTHNWEWYVSKMHVITEPRTGEHGPSYPEYTEEELKNIIEKLNTPYLEEDEEEDNGPCEHQFWTDDGYCEHCDIYDGDQDQNHEHRWTEDNFCMSCGVER